MHRIIFALVVAAAMTTSFQAAGDTQVKAATNAKAGKTAKCVFPKSKKRAPSWVCNPQTDGLALAAVGSTPKSGAGFSFMEQMAAADARMHLARELHKPAQGKPASDEENAAISKTANDSLAGIKVLKSVYSPNGTLYVLVGLDEEGAKKLKETINAN